MSETAFEDSLNAKFAALSEQEEAEIEAVAEEVGETQEQAPEVEEEAPPVEEETPTEAEERIYAGKYKSVEALEKAKLEADQLVGRQGQELGELRKMVESVQERMDAPQQPVYDDRAATVVNQLVEGERYQDAAIYALQANPYAYDAVMEAWYEAAPRQATQWELRLGSAQVRNELLQELGPRLQNIDGVVERERTTTVASQLQQKYPDFMQYAPAIQEYVEKERPEWKSVLEAAPPERQVAIIDDIYRLVRDRDAETHAKAEQGTARVQAEEERRAKETASVASASSATPRGGTGDWKKALKEAIFAEETISIESGLRRATE